MLGWTTKRRWGTALPITVDDLSAREVAAQESVVEISKRSLNLSRWQLVLGLLTVLGLLISLAFTLQSLRQTQEAMRIARSAMTVELAPYLSQTAQDLITIGDRPTIRIDVKNTGSTPALQPKWYAEVVVVPLDPKFDVPIRMKPRSEWSWQHVPEIGPDGQTHFSLAIKFEEGVLDRVLRKELAVAVNYVIEYEDRFGNPYRLQRADFYWGDNVQGSAVNKAYFGPDSLWEPSQRP